MSLPYSSLLEQLTDTDPAAPVYGAELVKAFSARAGAATGPADAGEAHCFRLYLITLENDFPLQSRMLLDSLHLAMPSEAVVLLAADRICIIKSGSGLRCGSREVAQRFENTLAARKACCGASRRFRTAGECPAAYEQARLALVLGQADRLAQKAGLRIFFYSAYAEMHELALYARKMGDLLPLLPAKLRGFYRDSLRDEGNLRLLSLFLDSGMSPSATAKALNIHRNTVIYRLNRMKEDYGIDLGRSDCLRDVMLLLSIADYRRRYSGGTA